MNPTSFFRIGLLAALSLIFSAAATAAPDAPEQAFEIVASEKVSIADLKWFPRDDGWLLTFRLRTKNERLVKNVSSVELEGLGEQDVAKVIWSKSKRIARNDYEGSYAGGREQFVRILTGKIPQEVTQLRLRYGEDPAPAPDAE